MCSSYSPLKIIANTLRTHFWGFDDLAFEDCEFVSTHWAPLLPCLFCNSHELSPPSASQCPGHELWLSFCFCSAQRGWRAASHNLYSRDSLGIDIDSIDINVTGQISSLVAGCRMARLVIRVDPYATSFLCHWSGGNFLFQKATVGIRITLVISF